MKSTTITPALNRVPKCPTAIALRKLAFEKIAAGKTFNKNAVENISAMTNNQFAFVCDSFSKKTPISLEDISAEQVAIAMINGFGRHNI